MDDGEKPVKLEKRNDTGRRKYLRSSESDRVEIRDAIKNNNKKQNQKLFFSIRVSVGSLYFCMLGRRYVLS